MILYAQAIAAAISAVSTWYTNKQKRKDAGNAVQRRADDLRAAGFNPVLAAGASASSANLESPARDAVEGTKASSALSLQKKLIAAQTAKLGAETRKADAQTDVLGKQAPLREAELAKAQFMGKLFKRLDSLGISLEQLMHKPGWADFLIKYLNPQSSARGTVKDLQSVGGRLFDGLGFKSKPSPGRIYEKGERIPPNTPGRWEETADGIRTGRFITKGTRPTIRR